MSNEDWESEDSSGSSNRSSIDNEESDYSSEESNVNSDDSDVESEQVKESDILASIEEIRSVGKEIDMMKNRLLFRIEQNAKQKLHHSTESRDKDMAPVIDTNISSTNERDMKESRTNTDNVELLQEKLAIYQMQRHDKPMQMKPIAMATTATQVLDTEIASNSIQSTSIGIQTTGFDTDGDASKLVLSNTEPHYRDSKLPTFNESMQENLQPEHPPITSETFKFSKFLAKDIQLRSGLELSLEDLHIGHGDYHVRSTPSVQTMAHPTSKPHSVSFKNPSRSSYSFFKQDNGPTNANSVMSPPNTMGRQVQGSWKNSVFSSSLSDGYGMHSFVSNSVINDQHKTDDELEQDAIQYLLFHRPY